MAKDIKLKLSKYKGQSILLVNIATRCGYTSQLNDLESLYKKYRAKGFIVLGIPSNDFAGQTPEENSEVVKFCKRRYGVTFPISKKEIVKGIQKIDLFKYATSMSNGGEISWNFEKFLFDKHGKLIERFNSKDVPLGGALEKKLQSIL
jgi:glutathione peroxidase